MSVHHWVVKIVGGGDFVSVTLGHAGPGPSGKVMFNKATIRMEAKETRALARELLKAAKKVA